MSEPKSDFLRDILARGFMHQCTDLDALDAAAAKGVVTAYIGYDCTGPSLHVGHMVSIMMLRRMQQTGHKPIVLMGGGTTKVGDPSGKDEARQLLSDEQIAANMASIRASFENYLTFGDGPNDAVMVNNDDWLSTLAYIPFLRDFGRHFSVNRMLSMDSVKLRLEREQPLSFLEFNYMILQAYDFVELHRRYGCILQMGGSDQWGNIVNGVDLGRRVADAQLFGLTTPLITTASGAKMGKTASGAVWLNPDMRSPWDYWQFWRNTEDADVGRFLRLFTDLPLDEVARLERLEGAEINEAKKILANEVTALCHGRAAAQEAAETARKTFEEGTTGDALPVTQIAAPRLAEGILLYEAMREAGLAASNGEARRLIKGGGARVNDTAISDEAHKVTSADLGGDGTVKLSAGKKRHALLRAV
ncbi:MAG: tyrosine--tRNA ligase [Proteobacteria bacterium]|nr:tyrosine--tRNA ligase [Pseudomonadota bacterium]MDA1071877.1 tyrosine--tRNA ligase [Pseudomonadota bacterium]